MKYNINMSHNELFLKKFNELDMLCRDKYKMFRLKNGKRNNNSAILKYARTLPEMQRQKLEDIAKLRNLIAHTNTAIASDQSIKDLDAFIAMFKRNDQPKSNKDFELVNYINHNSKKLKWAIRELEIDGEDWSYQIKKRIKDEAYSYVSRLEAAKDMETAKKAVRDFYTFSENLDDHPLVIKNELEDQKRDAIQELNEALYDVLEERKNPFVKAKAKERHKRYKEMILSARYEEEVEDALDRGLDSLNELY